MPAASVELRPGDLLVIASDTYASAEEWGGIFKKNKGQFKSIEVDL